MICALIGDRTIGNLAEGHLEDRLRVLIEERHVSAFVMGYFGPFERLALRVIRRLQQDYPLLDYTVSCAGREKRRRQIRSLTICTLCTRRAAGSGPDGSG